MDNNRISALDTSRKVKSQGREMLIRVPKSFRWILIPVFVLLFMAFTTAACDFPTIVGGDVEAETCKDTIVVNDTGDYATGPGTVCTEISCSLRAAIRLANECPGPAEIQLLDKTYTISVSGFYPEGTLSIRDDLTITGVSQDTTTIRADSGFQDKLFEIQENLIVRFQKVIIENGGGSDSLGGAIYNNGSLSLHGVTLQNNTGNFGGGLYNTAAGLVSMSKVRLLDNSARACGGAVFNAGNMVISDLTLVHNNFAQRGAGLCQLGGGVHIFNSEFVANGDTSEGITEGGGIFAAGGELEVSGTIITENRAVLGGGIYLDMNATNQVDITNSILSGNQALWTYARNSDVIIQAEGGGLYIYGGPESSGRFSIMHSSIIDNNASHNGGGLFLDGPFSPGSAIRESAIVANSADAGNGGGINLALTADLDVINVTISGNEAAQGGGVYSSHGSLPPAYESRDDVRFTNVTIADNSGWGVYADCCETITFSNSLVTLNDEQNCTIAGGNIHSAGFNVEDQNQCLFNAGTDLANSSNIVTSTSALEETGTYVHPLFAGDPIDYIPFARCPGWDQRGEIRPRGDDCDAGAYETLLGATSFQTPLPEATPEGNQRDEPGDQVEDNTPCYFGPGPQWGLISFLKRGERIDVIGRGFQPGWLVASHPTVAGYNCWIDEDDISLADPNAELSMIQSPDPPTPTPTAIREPRPEDPITPVPCYYDAQQQLICP